MVFIINECFLTEKDKRRTSKCFYYFTLTYSGFAAFKTPMFIIKKAGSEKIGTKTNVTTSEITRGS